MRPRVSLSLLLVAGLLGGCSSMSSSAVTRDSIVSLPSGFNLLLNPRFEASKSSDWTITAPGGAKTRFAQRDGRGVLTISRHRPGVSGALVVTQQPSFLPDTNPGASYILRERMRATGISRPLKTEIKLYYQGGGYAFFSAAPTGQGLSPDGPGAALTGSTGGWITLQARATAALPLTGLEVFVVDSLPTPKLSGTVAIEDPVLSLASPAHTNG